MNIMIYRCLEPGAEDTRGHWWHTPTRGKPAGRLECGAFIPYGHGEITSNQQPPFKLMTCLYCLAKARQAWKGEMKRG
jgi:hypothetical protein